VIGAKQRFKGYGLNRSISDFWLTNCTLYHKHPACGILPSSWKLELLFFPSPANGIFTKNRECSRCNIAQQSRNQKEFNHKGPSAAFGRNQKGDF
jgi:hypothetical protein